MKLRYALAQRKRVSAMQMMNEVTCFPIPKYNVVKLRKAFVIAGAFSARGNLIN